MAIQGQVPSYETWENNNKHEVWVTKFNAKGDTQDEVVQPNGGRLKIRPDERRYNQDIAYSSSQDLFSNGILSRVEIHDTAEDAEEILANPNLVTDADIAGYLKLTVKGLEEKLSTIDSPSVLERLKSLADEDDNLTMGKKKAIEKRHSEIVPKIKGQVFDDMTGDIPARKIR